jgi:hypothetical protein
MISNRKEKIVLIGAGSASFTRGLVADLIRREWDLEIGLVDVDPDALAVAEGLTRKMIAAHDLKIPVSGSIDRRAILKGATVVICTVGVGGWRGWEQDVFIPRKYGLYYPVGDTVGPGGGIPPEVGPSAEVGFIFGRAGGPDHDEDGRPVGLGREGRQRQEGGEEGCHGVGPCG